MTSVTRQPFWNLPNSLTVARIIAIPVVVVLMLFPGPKMCQIAMWVFVIACIGYDFFSRHRIHPAYLVGGLFILAMQPMRIVVSTTPWWLAFGDWLKG